MLFIFLFSLIEIRSYNRLERKDTYNVIGIMRGDIEPGIIKIMVFFVRHEFLVF
jgi:hypothetical protein